MARLLRTLCPPRILPNRGLTKTLRPSGNRDGENNYRRNVWKLYPCFCLRFLEKVLAMAVGIVACRCQTSVCSLVHLFYSRRAQTRIWSDMRSSTARAKPRRCMSQPQNGNEWIMSVSDNGIGIDAPYREQERLHGPQVAGAGIGLALSKKIIERRGGRIWIESPPEPGDAFVLCRSQEELLIERRPSEHLGRTSERSWMAMWGVSKDTVPSGWRDTASQVKDYLPQGAPVRRSYSSSSL